jgi:sugar/nucleoside kinase (ribokinase family)
VDLLTVGEAFEDLIFAGLPRVPRPGEELRVPIFARSIGGGAVITACAAARLGLRVGTLTAMGAGAAAELRRERVSVISLQRAGERGAISVALSMPHERSFVTYDGVNTLLEPRLLRKLRRLPRARHVHFALSPRTCRAWLPIVHRVRQHGATTSWDFGWNERLLKDRSFQTLLKAVDWLFLNDQEARFYSRVRSLASARTHWSARNGGTVIKRGAKGALVLVDGGMHRVDAGPARVLDTTGAGDAFNGAFLTALLRGAGPAAAASFANYVGARATEQLGGVAGLPRLRDLPRRTRAHLGAA